MILATLETSNFTFEAYGQTTQHAMKALQRGLVQHATQYGLKPGWYEVGDVQTRYIEMCRAYRDREPMRKE